MNKKDDYYFPHFCNARHNRKIRRIRKELGIEGYAIYFMLLEVLRAQTDFKYPYADLDLLADEFNISEQKIKVVISSYDLFQIDEENNFFSEKLIFYLQPYLEKSKRARNAILKRWDNYKLQQSTDTQNDTNEIQMYNKSNTNVIQVKESKVKKSKEKEPIEIFSKTLFDIFLSEYKNSRNDDYVFTNKKTQINAIKKLIEFYNAKESNKGKTEEEKIIDFTNLFKQMININDAFHWERISLQYIVKYFQVLKNIIQKPKVKHETTKSVFNSRLSLTADDLEHSRDKFLREYGVGEIADAN